MTENQNAPKVQSVPVSNQNSEKQNNQKEVITLEEKPKDKTVEKVDEKIKLVLAEENKEHVDLKHPHETSIPVSQNNKDKASL
jgi:hypothetical protein